MKTRLLIIFLLINLISVQTVSAATMTSTNYSVQADSINFGGDRSVSASYISEDTGGEVATGISQSANNIMSAGYQQADAPIVVPPTPTPTPIPTPPGGSTSSGGSGGPIFVPGFPVNVINFIATPTTRNIILTWTIPLGSDIQSVRIVRSENFFPSGPNDGDVIFEGVGQSAVDNNVVSGREYYYALFARNSTGEFSSGVLARAHLLSLGEPSVPPTNIFIDPFAGIDFAEDINPIIGALVLSDFDFIQDGRKIEFQGENLAIDAGKGLTVKLDYGKVPEILKTIAVTLTDPDDSSKVFTFLLRINKDKTAYEATIAPLQKPGIYGLHVVILDFKNQGLKRISGFIHVLSLPESQPLSGVFGSAWLLYSMIGLLILAFLIIIFFVLHNRRKKRAFISTLIFFLCVSIYPHSAEAVFNKEINYQGKLADSAGVFVPNGNYNIRFNLYTTAIGGAPIYTETECFSPDAGVTCDGTGTDSRVVLTSGLLSTMIGSIASLATLDFNQTLYLGVEIGGAGAVPAWDGEMTPRKIIGAVPAAFVADNANFLNGLTSSQFLRSDIGSVTTGFFVATSTTASSTFANGLNLTGGCFSVNGVCIASNATSTNFWQPNGTSIFNTNTGNVGIGTTTPGQMLSVAGDILGNRIIGTNFTATSSSSASTFPLASTTALTVSGLNGFYLNPSFNGFLQVINGAVTSSSTLSAVNGGTGQSAYAVGDILYADTPNSLARLPIGSPGLVLKVGAGTPIWATDISSGGGGGASLFSTTTNNLIIYPSNPSHIFVLGGSATTTTGNIFEVIGNSKLGGNVQITGTLTLDTLNGPLQANNGVVSATTSIGVLYGGTGLTTAPTFGQLLVGNLAGGYTLTSTSSLNLSMPLASTTGTLPVARGGTGQTSFNQGWLGINDAGAFISSTSPTVNYITATSTTASSTFANGLNLTGGCFSVGGTCISATGSNLWATNGTSIFNTNSGNVGIGTTTPDGKLSVYLNPANTFATEKATFGPATTIANYGSGYSGLWLGGLVSQNAPSATNYTLISNGTGPILNAPAGGTLNFAIANVVRMILSPAGNLGIGTTTPGQKLSVAGDILGNNIIGSTFIATSTTASSTFANGLNLTGGCFSVNGVCIASNATSTNFWFANGNDIFNSNTGNVGIGTSTPGQKLSVAGDILGNRIIGTSFTSTSTTVTSTFNSFINTLGKTGGYKIDNNLILQASSTRNSLALGLGALNASHTGSVNIAIGENALALLTTGNSNLAVGRNALVANTTGSNNSAFGHSALLNNTTGSNNIAIGGLSLSNTSTGGNNAALGYQSLLNNGTGDNNVAIGFQAGNDTSTGAGNNAPFTSIYIGSGSRSLNSSGTNEIVVGSGAIGFGTNSAVLGDDNILKTILKGNVGIGTTTPGQKLSVAGDILGNRIIGSSFTATSTTASSTFANGLNLTGGCFSVGGVCIASNATSTNFWFANGANIFNSNAGNVGIGTSTPGQKLSVVGNADFTGFVNTSGTTGGYKIEGELILQASSTLQTIALGNHALNNFGTGFDNIAVGQSSLTSNTNGTKNIGIGSFSLLNNLTGSNNIAIGYDALADSANANDNIAIGNNALFANDTGTQNLAIGINALFFNGGGSQNIALGANALNLNGEGNENTAIGVNSLSSSSGGLQNSALGANSLLLNIGGNQNSAFGNNALSSNTSGSLNSALGFQAGTFIANGTTPNQTSSNSLYLGSNSRAFLNGDTNEIVIGDSAIGVGSNSVVLGADSIFKTILKGNVGIGTTTPGQKLSVAGDILGNRIIGSSFTATSTTASSTFANGLNLTGGCFSVGGVCLPSNATSTNFWQPNGTSIYNSNTGNVGIGTTSPSQLLTVQGHALFGNDTSSSLSVSPGTNVLAVNELTTNTTGDVFGIQSQLETNPASASSRFYYGGYFNSNTSAANSQNITGRLVAIQGQADHNGSGTVNEARGVAGIVSNQGVGTITNGYGGRFSVSNNAAGTITNAYGAYILSGANAGTITNRYGLFIENQANASTLNYAIFSAGGTNYFGGNVGIGTTTPGQKLSVAGDILGNNIIGSTFIATSTTASSTFANGLNLTGGCFSVNGVCIASNATSTNFWFANGANIFNSNAGNVGIGTSTPGQKLSVAGDILGNNIIGSYFNATSTTVTSNFASFINTSGTTGGYKIDNNLVFQASSTQSSYAIGLGALNTSYTGGANIAIGQNALLKDTTGSNNSALGDSALSNNTTGFQNTGIGASALIANTTAQDNTGIGRRALFGATTGGANSAVGSGVLSNLTTGFLNSAIGFNAGNSTGVGNNITSNTSVYLGAQSTALADGDANEIVIGYLAGGLGSNSAVLGNDSILKTILKGNVGIGTTTPGQKLSVAGDILGNNHIGSFFTATSTTASSTFANGLNLTGGCFSVGGTCISATGSNLWAANGTSIFNTNTGNVGIGTTAPLSKLGVAGNLSIGATFGAQAAPTSGAIIEGNVGIGTVNPLAKLQLQTPIGEVLRTSFTSDATFYHSIFAGYSATPASDYLAFNVNNGTASTQAEVMRLVGNGNVGIGTTTPGQKLSVAGDILGNNIIGSTFISTSTTASSTFANGLNLTGGCFSVGGVCIPSNATSTNFWQPNGTAIFNTNTGNVGIGTTTPLGKLDVSGASVGTDGTVFDGNRAVSIINTNTTNNNMSGLDFRTMDTNGLLTTGAKVMGVYTSHAANAISSDLTFLNRNAGTMTENMRILANGNVGIGTASPNFKLEVNGTASTTVLSLPNTASATVGVINFGGSRFIHNFGGTNSIFMGVSAGNLSYSGTGNNIGIGTLSLNAVTTANRSIAIGTQALSTLTTGSQNVGIGYQALQVTLDGANNVGVGYSALNQNSSGSNNTAIGFNANQTNQTGANNTSVGNSVLNLATGNNNVAFGYHAGENLTTGSNNIVLGFDIDTPSDTSSNSLNIGNLLFGTGIDGTNKTLSSGNIGIGTTTPGTLLSLGNTGVNTVNISAAATSTFGSGLNIRTGCFAVGGVCIPSNATSTNFWQPNGTNIFNTNTGNVGIGTTTPTAKLTVSSDATINGQQGTLQLASLTSPNKWLSAGFSNATDAGYLQATDFTVAFKNLLLEPLGGNVGIGTSTPDTKLTVYGGIKSGDTDGTINSGSLLINSSVSSGSNGTVTFNNDLNGTDRDFVRFLGGFNNNLAYISAGSSYSQPVLRVETTNAGAAGAVLSVTQAGTGDVISAVAGATNVFSVKSNGRVGIGTTTPLGKLSIDQNVSTQIALNIRDTFSSPSLALVSIERQNNISGGGTVLNPALLVNDNVANFPLAVNSGTTNLFAIKGNGNVGIATTSPWRTLSVTGSAAITGLTAGGAGDFAVCINNVTKELTNAGATGCVVSSNRFKDNINPLKSGLDEVMLLKPSVFSLKNLDPKDLHLGLIAEDVDLVDKRLVQYEADGVTPRTVRYEELTALLIKAIQEQQVQINFLQNATSTLATPQSFIATIADAVKNLIQSAGEWTISKITSTLAIFTRIETQTASIKNGLEITDQATGQLYCVTIRNGDWDKVPGACGTVATTTPPTQILIQTPIAPPAYIPPEAPIATSTPIVLPISTSTPEIIPTPPTISTSTPPVSETPPAPVITPPDTTTPPSEPAPAPEPASAPVPEVAPEPAPAPAPAPEPAPAPAPESAPATP